jgi:hypothetical protein
MKKLIFIVALVMFSAIVYSQEPQVPITPDPLKQTTEQMNAEIIVLKENVKQEKIEVARHKANIRHQNSQIRSRQKIVKSIKKYQ